MCEYWQAGDHVEGEKTQCSAVNGKRGTVSVCHLSARDEEMNVKPNPGLIQDASLLIPSFTITAHSYVRPHILLPRCWEMSILFKLSLTSNPDDPRGRTLIKNYTWYGGWCGLWYIDTSWKSPSFIMTGQMLFVITGSLFLKITPGMFKRKHWLGVRRAGIILRLTISETPTHWARCEWRVMDGDVSTLSWSV